MTLQHARVTDPRENARLFNRIAPRYDLLNRLMSLGQDLRWRLALLDRVAGTRGPLLDLCTGTGDVGLLAAARWPERMVMGADASLGMMREGRRKAGRPLTGWIQGDGLRLPIRSGVVGAVTVAFGVRNIIRRAELWAELRRVLSSAGRLAILDIFAPRSDWLGRCYDLYLRRAVPALGALVGGDGPAYRHLAASVESFGRPEELASDLSAAGFRAVGCRALNFGTIGLVWGDAP